MTDKEQMRTAIEQAAERIAEGATNFAGEAPFLVCEAILRFRMSYDEANRAVCTRLTEALKAKGYTPGPVEVAR